MERRSSLTFPPLFHFFSFPLFLTLGLFALFTSAAFDYQTDKRLAGAVIACTAFYVMNFAYSVRTLLDPFLAFISTSFGFVVNIALLCCHHLAMAYLLSSLLGFISNSSVLSLSLYACLEVTTRQFPTSRKKQHPAHHFFSLFPQFTIVTK